MLRVGLTGGIACGKTTVVAMLRELGCLVIEADPLAHRLIEPGQPAFEEVRREFGNAILTPDGRVDRAKLGAIVFAYSARLQRLNQILHPRIAQGLNEQLARLERAGQPAIAVVEAALLIEANFVQHLDRLAVAWCRPEQQVERLLARGMNREQAWRRIAAQMPIEEKRRRANDVIDCSGTMEQTREQTARLLEQWKQRAKEKASS